MAVERILRFIFFAIIFIAIVTLVFRCQKQKWFSFGEEKSSSVHNIIVEKMEQMGTLELVKFKIKDVVEQKIERSWIKGGDTKVLVVISGEAVGCIDLREIKAEDIKTEDSTITIILPQPKLCYAKINHNESKVFDAPHSPFQNNAAAVDSAYKSGEVQITDAALQMGILEQTRENALIVLKPILETISGKNVILSFEAAPQIPVQIK